jgi:hypothetical protein
MRELRSLRSLLPGSLSPLPRERRMRGQDSYLPSF